MYVCWHLWWRHKVTSNLLFWVYFVILLNFTSSDIAAIFSKNISLVSTSFGVTPIYHIFCVSAIIFLLINFIHMMAWQNDDRFCLSECFITIAFNLKISTHSLVVQMGKVIHFTHVTNMLQCIIWIYFTNQYMLHMLHMLQYIKVLYNFYYMCNMCNMCNMSWFPYINRYLLYNMVVTCF